MPRSAARPLRSFNATQAKNRFGVILKAVAEAQPVFIEKHGSLYAVILDIESYKELMHKARSPQEVQLDELRAEFDALYAHMQTPAFRKATDALSKTSATELNAVAAKRLKLHG